VSHCHFLVPGSLDRPTGGSRYDRAIVEGLRQAGQPVVVHELAGEYPGADPAAEAAVAEALRQIPPGTPTVVDGLVLGALPTCFAAESGHLPTIALIHHPLGEETGLSHTQADALLRQERAALATVNAVLATSEFTAGRLRELGLYRGAVHIAPPGVQRADVIRIRPNGDLVQLLCIGSITPRKGQDVLVEALHQLSDCDWQCHLIGDTRLNATFARQVKAQISRYDLTERITLPGALSADALEQAYQAADLFVLPSHYEGYGMVITEAIAHGLPIVTTTGGALATTLPPTAGLATPPGDATALATALRQVITDPHRHDQLARGARIARETLADWQPAIATVMALVQEMNQDA